MELISMNFIFFNLQLLTSLSQFITTLSLLFYFIFFFILYLFTFLIANHNHYHLWFQWKSWMRKQKVKKSLTFQYYFMMIIVMIMIKRKDKNRNKSKWIWFHWIDHKITLPLGILFLHIFLVIFTWLSIRATWWYKLTKFQLRFRLFSTKNRENYS